VAHTGGQAQHLHKTKAHCEGNTCAIQSTMSR
jgi:hypothetical protein